MASPTPLLPAYVLWGEDRSTVERAVARLVARVAREGGLPPERFRLPEARAEDVVAALEALSLAGLRLVIVDGADQWRAADVGPLVDYLAAPNPASCVALVAHGSLSPALHTAVAGLGGELRYGPDPKAKPAERRKWMAEHLSDEVRRRGGAIPGRLAARVVERTVGDGTGGTAAAELARAAEKLADYAGGQEITWEMAQAVIPHHPEARVYELADALVAADAPRAYDLLRDLAGGDEHVPPIVIQVQLSNRFRSLAAVQAHGAPMAPEEVARLLGMRPYPARLLAEQAERLPPGAARAMVARCAALELDLRVSSFAELGDGRTSDDGQRLVLEVAARELMEIARGGVPAAR